MATLTLITPQVGNSYCPQMKLVAVTQNETATSVEIKCTVSYVTHGYTFSSSSSPEVSEKINGTWYDEVGWAVGGKTSQTVRTRTVSITKTTSQKSVEVVLYWGMSGFSWNGTAMSNMRVSGNITVPALASYPVTYNANGGSGAPASQTKWHGVTLVLAAASANPTRDGYEFAGWTDGTTTYAAGASYTANAALALSAVWNRTYIAPTCDIAAFRTGSASGTSQVVSGAYARVEASWAVDTTVTAGNAASAVSIEYKATTESGWHTAASSQPSAASGTIAANFSASTGTAYDVRVSVTDSVQTTYYAATVGRAGIPLDIGRHGASVGILTAAPSFDGLAIGNGTVSLIGETSTYSETMDTLIGMLGAADYVVEQGTGYRKWNSGKMECWVSQSVSTTISTSWGNLYRSGSITGPNWPQAFDAIAASTCSLYADGGEAAFFASSGGQRTTKATNGYILRSETLTSAKSFTITYWAVGTWK
mgnify:CR=1 FL=1